MATLSEYRSREHWSFSALNQFLNICSLQFFYDRIAKLPKHFTPISLSFGSAYHRALEWVNLQRKDGETPQPAEGSDLFAEVWSRQLDTDNDIRFGKDQDAETCRNQGMDMVSAYIERIDPGERVISVNEAFAVAMVDVAGNVLEKPMIGELDLVVDANGIVVCDEKSSARRWPKGQADKSLQPTAYLYAYQQIHGGDIVPFRFQVAVKQKKVVLEHHETRRKQDQFQRMIELVKAVDSMIAAEHFLPNEGSFYCGGCPHHAACRAWHRNRARVTLPLAA
jgi:putative RecB family exonuclease